MTADFYATGYRAGQIGLNEMQARAEVRRAIGRELHQHERSALESGRRAGRADALAESGEEPVVQVVNVRGLTGAARAGVVYCGRRCAGWAGHPLANPFKMRSFGAGGACQTVVAEWNKRERERCVAEYRAWLLARPTLDADLAALWEQTRRGALPLGCWCCEWAGEPNKTPQCHAVILAELLTQRFGVE